MKHLIVFNGKAGQEKDVEAFKKEIDSAFKGLDYEIYVTEGPKKAISFLKDYFKKNTKDVVRVYACGGDGTVHEAANALVGVKNAELAVLAVGTGNDFVKSYAKSKDYDEIITNKAGEGRFKDFKALIEGKTEEIDLSKLTSPSLKEPMYSINVINFGFDAIVGAMGNYYKEHGYPEKAKAKGMSPYDYALKNDAMKHGRFNDITVYADEERLNEKKMLLATLAQGRFVGGTFLCAPKSDNKDGLIDVCVIKTMTLIGLGLFIGPYTKGKHLNKPKKKIVYRQAKKIRFESPNEIDVCVDGEMIKGKSFEVEVCPKAIKFVVPNN